MLRGVLGCLRMKPARFERQHHLMNRWWADAESIPACRFRPEDGDATACTGGYRPDGPCSGGEEFFSHLRRPFDFSWWSVPRRRGGTDECTLSCHIDPIRARNELRALRLRVPAQRHREPVRVPGREPPLAQGEGHRAACRRGLRRTAYARSRRRPLSRRGPDSRGAPSTTRDQRLTMIARAQCRLATSRRSALADRDAAGKSGGRPRSWSHPNNRWGRIGGPTS